MQKCPKIVVRKKKKEINASKIYSPVGKCAERAKLRTRLIMKTAFISLACAVSCLGDLRGLLRCLTVKYNTLRINEQTCA